jgi:hypothetical protein
MEDDYPHPLFRLGNPLRRRALQVAVKEDDAVVTLVEPHREMDCKRALPDTTF